MSELPYIDNSDRLASELENLAKVREDAKLPTGSTKRFIIPRSVRVQIHQKTDGRCHFCGCSVSIDRFEADHVKNHTSGGNSQAENFLPSCRTCNNYRWHYSPEELQWILKIGVWVRHQIAKRTTIGNLVAKYFIKKEIDRESRRKTSRAT